MARKPHRTSRIARLAGLAIAVVGMAFATASWASITSSENPSTDGSYTVSWSWVPNAHAYQLYEDGTLVYDSTGTSWSFSGKAAGDYEYTVGYCEFIFDEEMCYGSVYTALTVTVSVATATATATGADGERVVRREFHHARRGRHAELVVDQRQRMQRGARDRLDGDLGDEDVHAVERGQLQRDSDLHG